MPASESHFLVKFMLKLTKDSCYGAGFVKFAHVRLYDSVHVYTQHKIITTQQTNPLNILHMNSLRLFIALAVSVAGLPSAIEVTAGYNYLHYTRAELTAESSQPNASALKGRYVLVEPVSGLSIGRITSSREPSAVTIAGAAGHDWFMLDRAKNDLMSGQDAPSMLQVEFNDGYVRLIQVNTPVSYDPSTGKLGVGGANTRFTLDVDDEGYCVIRTVPANDREKTWQFNHDAASGTIRLVEEMSAPNLRLYYRDPYMFGLADPYNPMAGDGTVEIAHSIFTTDVSDCHIVFNDGTIPTDAEFEAAVPVRDVQLNDWFDYTEYAARKTFTITNPDRRPHMWVKAIHSTGRTAVGDGMVFHACLDGSMVTSEAEGHFTTPASKQVAGTSVDFVRQPGVKIYYTVDGSVPVVPTATSALSDGTFDLDHTPLLFDGTEIPLNFIALKPGLMPSQKVGVTLSVNGSTGLDAIISTGSDGAAEYYNLQGQRVMSPSVPGLYIVRTSVGTSKTIIR